MSDNALSLPPQAGPPQERVLAWVADVLGAAKAGDWPKAIRWAEHALSQGIEHPKLLQVRAVGRERSGRLDEALIDLERAYRIDPDDVAVANALGVRLTRAGAHDRAMGVLEAAVRTRPDIPDSQFNLGAAQLAAGALVDARASFERAAQLDPQGPAFGKLALLAAHRGDGVEARSMAARALQIAPADPDARRALIEADIDDRQFAKAEDGARDWLSIASLGPNARHQATGLLGDALDGQGRAAEAFQAYADSNAAFRTTYAKSLQAFQTRPLSATFRDMQTAFARADLGAEAWALAPSLAPVDAAPPRRHVFLMGFMRSGTTLLEQALARHPDVAALEETEALAAGADLLVRADGFDRLADLDAPEADDYRRAYWAAVRGAGVEPAGKVFVDKLPFNGAKLPLIAKLFPEARIVFALRDPRDVVFSCFQRRLRPNGYAYELSDLADAARLYDAYMSLVSRYRASLDLQIYDHRHEALVDDFEGAVRAVCEHIGLEFDPAMTAFGASAGRGQVSSQTARQLQGGVNARGVGRWRAYAEQMAPALPLLQPWVEAFGYGDG